jgi:hypothetical protein
MGAYEEFARSGRLGEEGARLLYATVAAVVRVHGYPPPHGHSTWGPDAVEAVAHDFLTSPNAERRLGQLFISAVDGASFARLLGTAVLNHLRSEARRTMIGRLIRRLNDVLAGSPEFRRTLGSGGGEAWWTLAEGIDDAGVSDPGRLLQAAAEVREVQVPRWSDAARRQPPDADRESLTRLARRVLEVAGGALPVSELARAIAPRLGLGPLPLAADIDVHDLADTVAASENGIQGALDAIRAEELFASLTERERLVLAYSDEPVREFAPKIGLAKSQAATARQRLVEFLRVRLAEDPDPDGVVRLLVERARSWGESRTGDLDASSGEMR